jgi:cyclopropane fatty-acyl-phospholipid synthase-like methyltransferase
MIAWREHQRFGVPVIHERIFGQDYAKTLAIWRSNFCASWPRLMPSRRRNSLRRTNRAQNASTFAERALGSVSIYNRPAKIPS